jgi:hypothetical protein
MTLEKGNKLHHSCNIRSIARAAFLAVPIARITVATFLR